MRHRTLEVMVLVLFGIFGLSAYAAALSYSVVEEQREEKAAKGIRERGEMVCLFQSGTEDVKQMIGIGDILSVYRDGANRESTVVGKIKIVSYAGEDYIKGEVVEGSVQTGDVAKKGSVAILVISSNERCK